MLSFFAKVFGFRSKAYKQIAPTNSSPIVEDDEDCESYTPITTSAKPKPAQKQGKAVKTNKMPLVRLDDGQNLHHLVEDSLLQFTIDLNIITCDVYPTKTFVDPLSLIRYAIGNIVQTVNDGELAVKGNNMDDSNTSPTYNIYFIKDILRRTVLGIVKSTSSSQNFQLFNDGLEILVEIFSIYPKKNNDDISIPIEGILAILVRK